MQAESLPSGKCSKFLYTTDYTVKDTAVGEYSVTCISYAEKEDLFDEYFQGTEYGHAVVEMVAD